MFTILGASGYIGGKLASSLRSGGLEVFTPNRDEPLRFSQHLGHVIYAIGLTSDFRTRPFDTSRAHVSLLVDLLENCNFSSVTYLSSTRVYSRGSGSMPGTTLLVQPGDPQDLYNLTKLTGESLCLHSGRPCKVVRLSNVIGVGEPQSHNFIDSLVRDALTGKVVIRSHQHSSKDYIALDNVVDMLPKIAVSGKRRIYNLASGENICHQEWTDSLEELLSCEVEYLPGAEIQEFPQIDINDLVREFDFRPVRATEALPSLIEHHLKLL